MRFGCSFRSFQRHFELYPSFGERVLLAFRRREHHVDGAFGAG